MGDALMGNYFGRSGFRIRVNRWALRGSADAPFLRNIPAMEGGGYNSFEFLKKLEANFCTRMYENWQRCPFNP